MRGQKGLVKITKFNYSSSSSSVVVVNLSSYFLSSINFELLIKDTNKE